MLTEEGKVVGGMALFRMISAAIEVTAAMLMLKFGRVETAVQINALLGLVGPVILITVSALGLAGLAGKVPLSKLALLGAGVALILIALRR